MTQPLQISGTIKLGEANATLPDLRARIGGSPWLYQFALVVMVAIAAIVGWEWQHFAGVVICVAVIDFAYNWFGARLLRSAYRSRWIEGGQKTELPMSLTLETDALISETAEVRRIIGWGAVTELFRSKGYWIFIVQGEGIYAPSRLFATVEEEKAFVASALSHMSESARNQSVGAVSYASGN